MSRLRVFIGYDPREASAYYTCQQSIIEHCADPTRLSFTPVTGPLRDGSNAFIYARFLVPYLCGFVGSAVFLDGDMLVRTDIADLFAQPLIGIGARVVKHDYKTKYPVKYLGYPNQDYPRKNWSSVILWNCNYFPNRCLTPEYIESHDGKHLHRFSWLADHQIGELHATWNKLVLEQDLNHNDKLRHFTIGIPAFQEYADCDGAEEWHETRRRAMTP